MACTIRLAELSWTTPDGRPLFSGLSLNFGPEQTGLVGRNGVGKTSLLRLISGDLRPRSGSVSVGGSVAFLRQVVRVGTDETVADLFGASESLALLGRVEAGEATDEELADADWTLESRMTSALGRVGLDAGPETLLAALSGGQRTRAGLAALIFAEPDFLLLDEPTNNLDGEGRRAVLDLLAGWQAGAVVVSHDRELLDTMDSIVELTSLGATRYGGNWTRYRELKAVELEAAHRDLAEAERRVATVARNARAMSERQARRIGTGQRNGAKGGTPRILLGGRKDRGEDTGGGHARLAERLRG
jgi:ATPase subunit of ABC transporter with duplicated ATPase domains